MDQATAEKLGDETQPDLGVEQRRALRNKAEQARFTLYYPRLNLAYTYIPKNACSTIKGTLARAEDGRRFGFAPHELDKHYQDRPGDFDNSWTRILVLRDPVDRLISAYLDKITQMRAPSHYKLVAEIYAEHGRPAPNGADSVSLAEFFDWITRQDQSWLDAHWRPQHFMVTLDRYDHIMDARTLKRDWARAGLARIAPLETFDIHATQTTQRFGWWPRRETHLKGRNLLNTPGHSIRGYFETTGHFPSRSCFAEPGFLEQVRSFYEEDYRLRAEYGLTR